ncbi:MAG: hypothetical protein ABID63_18390 [Pseudomonadota bacterium]
MITHLSNPPASPAPAAPAAVPDAPAPDPVASSSAVSAMRKDMLIAAANGEYGLRPIDRVLNVLRTGFDRTAKYHERLNGLIHVFSVRGMVISVPQAVDLANGILAHAELHRHRIAYPTSGLQLVTKSDLDRLRSNDNDKRGPVGLTKGGA